MGDFLGVFHLLVVKYYNFFDVVEGGMPEPCSNMKNARMMVANHVPHGSACAYMIENDKDNAARKVAYL
jgi:hypothetical protein